MKLGWGLLAPIVALLMAGLYWLGTPQEQVRPRDVVLKSQVVRRPSTALRAAVPVAPTVPAPVVHLVGILESVNTRSSRAILQVNDEAEREFMLQEPLSGKWVLSRIQSDSVTISDGIKSQRILLTGGSGHAPGAVTAQKAQTNEQRAPVVTPIQGFGLNYPGMNAAPEQVHENNQRFLRAIQQRRINPAN